MLVTIRNLGVCYIIIHYSWYFCRREKTECRLYENNKHFDLIPTLFALSLSAPINLLTNNKMSDRDKRRNNFHMVDNEL